MQAAEQQKLTIIRLEQLQACAACAWPASSNVTTVATLARQKAISMRRTCWPTWIKFLPSFWISLGCKLILFICE